MTCKAKCSVVVQLLTLNVTAWQQQHNALVAKAMTHVVPTSLLEKRDLVVSGLKVHALQI